LVLEPPTALCPLLGFVYEQQQQRVLAIADEIKETRGFAEVSKIFFRKNDLI
jgi:hypothetical protein